jgi:GDPmannose 4,6-dehydratase
MTDKSAVVTGITGQDGSYLAELLLEEGYKVYGFKRRTSDNSLGCSKHLEKDIEVVEGDLLDIPSLTAVCRSAKPDHFYNLAAQSHVGTSFKQPVYTSKVSGLAVLHCLEAIKDSGFHTRFYQASTSELFGGQHGDKAMTERTPFHPRSPYGVAKCFGFWTTVNYREAYKMFACNGILFNHESPRRGPNFVTRKITMGIADIKRGWKDKIYLGNLDAKRDWGHAKDYVRGMYAMLTSSNPTDYILATGEAHSIRQFLEIAFEHAGLGDYSKFVEIDPQFYRPAEVDVLLGDASKAKKFLKWKRKYSFDDLVQEMVEHDLKEVGKDE